MTRPNVLFVLVDDLGWGDIHRHGSEVRTPNVDRLFDRGLELRRHYVCPTCTPTRAALMTGRYPSRFGTRATTPSNEPVLPDGYETLATTLSAAGYDTGLFGKWHLGSDPEHGPNEYGFEEAYGSLAGGVDPYNHRYKDGEYSETWHENGELIEEEGHATDLIADRASEWIRGREKPWFCYVPFTAVHVPLHAPERWLDEYEYEQFYADEELNRGRKLYAAYTSHVDEGIGRLIETLKLTCQLENTIVVVASDNGAIEEYPHAEEAKYPGWHWETPGLGSNFPLRGGKGDLYEGGIRTPAALMWEGTVESGQVDVPLGVADWMPTLSNLLDAPPAGDPGWDGVDAWPLIAGERTDPMDRSIYWNVRDTEFALYRDGWKVIADDSLDPERAELFDVESDPYEKSEASGNHPDVVADLLAEIEEEREADGVSRRAGA